MITILIGMFLVLFGFVYRKMIYAFILSNQDKRASKKGTIVDIKEENNQLFLIVETQIENKIERLKILCDEDKEKVKRGNQLYLRVDFNNYENSEIDWQKEILTAQAGKLKKAVDYPSLAMISVGFILIIKGLMEL